MVVLYQNEERHRGGAAMKPRGRNAQKAGLTKAIKSGDPRRVEYECRRVVQFDWASKWPDDWSLWVRALEDALGLGHPTVDEIFWAQEVQR